VSALTCHATGDSLRFHVARAAYCPDFSPVFRLLRLAWSPAGGDAATSIEKPGTDPLPSQAPEGSGAVFRSRDLDHQGKPKQGETRDHRDSKRRY